MSLTDASRRRPVVGTITADRSPRTTEAVIDTGMFATLGASLLELLCRFTTELVLLVALPASLFTAGYSFASSSLGITLAVGYFFIMLGVPSLRRLLFRSLSNARLRRRWEKACRFSGLLNHNDHFPTIRKVSDTVLGKRLVVMVVSGSSVEELGKAASRLAGVLEAREVIVNPDRTNARYAIVDMVLREPFADHAPIPWPLRGAGYLSMWDALPVGIDEHGELVSISFPYENLKVGGIPGTGKSIALSLIAASAALDRDCKLTVIDGKDVELSAWRSVAEQWSGSDLNTAADVINELRFELRRRYAFLEEHGRRKIERSDDLALHVVIIDELASFLIASNKEQKALRDSFIDGLTELVQKGRAAGIVVVYAMQKQGTDSNLPSGLRDLFSMSWAFRCVTPEASDTILGRGNASAGFDASDIGTHPPKGVSYLLHESGTPTKMRSFYLSDDDLHTIAERGVQLRKELPLRRRGEPFIAGEVVESDPTGEMPALPSAEPKTITAISRLKALRRAS